MAPHPVQIDPYGVPVARAPVDRREGAAGDLLIEHAPAQGDGLVPVRPVQTENERCPAVTDEDVVRFDPAVMEALGVVVENGRAGRRRRGRCRSERRAQRERPGGQ